MVYEYQVDVGGTMYSMGQIKQAGMTQPLFNTLSVGNACSAEFTMSFWPIEPPPRMAKVVPYIKGGDITEWDKLGEFWIDTRTKKNSLLEIVAYDSMMKADMVWQSEESITFPISMQEAVNKIAELMEVAVDSRTVINSSYTINGINEDDSMRNVLEYIAAAHAGNWIITAAGELLLVPLFNSMPEETYFLIKNDGNAITFGGTRIVV